MDLKEAASVCDTLSEEFAKLAAAFRAGGRQGGGEEVDGEAAAPVRASRKRRAKPDPDGDGPNYEADQGGEEGGEESEAPDFDTLSEQFSELVSVVGTKPVIALLKKFGAGRLSEVDEGDYGKLAAAIAEARAAAEKPAKGKAKAKAKPAVTLEEVLAVAQKVQKADKSKVRPILTEHGIEGKLSEYEDADPEVLQSLLDAFTAALEEEEDLV